MAKHPAAVALGKLGGRVRSEAKANASRENGKKGGRPAKHNDQDLANCRCAECLAGGWVLDRLASATKKRTT
jgi:hypothetical protein